MKWKKQTDLGRTRYVSGPFELYMEEYGERTWVLVADERDVAHFRTKRDAQAFIETAEEAILRHHGVGKALGR